MWRTVVAWWVYASTKRVDQFNRLRSAAESEKATLILDNARRATKAERELNDFIAHEVLNPVAAAMSACSFVKIIDNALGKRRETAVRDRDGEGDEKHGGGMSYLRFICEWQGNGVLGGWGRHVFVQAVGM
jgi:hypothetical protein